MHAKRYDFHCTILSVSSSSWSLKFSRSRLNCYKIALRAIAMPHGMLNYYTFLLGLEFLSATTTVSATCFLPNGTDRSLGYRPADQYIPINTGDNVTMCCAATDGPRSDGLCVSGTNIYRESCTDQSWQDPRCIKLCAGSDNGKGNPLSVLWVTTRLIPECRHKPFTYTRPPGGQ